MAETIVSTPTGLPQLLRDAAQVRLHTTRIVEETSVFDMHTHLFPPAFTELTRWGIDELLTYHYLVAELMRTSDVRPETYQRMPKSAQADLVWDTLFVRNTPLSEATCGVIAVLTALGLDPSSSDLRGAREFFRDVTPSDHVAWVFERARVEGVVMTNDPFDAREVRVWNEAPVVDGRFRTALRLDTLLNDWSAARHSLTAAGYAAAAQPDAASIVQARRFVDAWVERIDPLYMAVSLAADFAWPGEGSSCQLLRDVVLPACRDHGLPLAMMIGVRRGVNPGLLEAGDALGRADVTALHRICAEHPDNRFLITMLSRENQHELRSGAQVRQPDAVRLLVVSQQSVDRLRDHARATRDAGRHLRRAAFRCPRAGAAPLQVAARQARGGAGAGRSIRACRRERTAGDRRRGEA